MGLVDGGSREGVGEVVGSAAVVAVDGHRSVPLVVAGLGPGPNPLKK